METESTDSLSPIDFSTKSNLQSHIDSWSKLSLLHHCRELKEAPTVKFHAASSIESSPDRLLENFSSVEFSMFGK
ncbi:uncharacterized protein C8R40DRAFT_1126739 [Lentinula edodes]|uniref:uncharacterized protein n=1 Tax=Lentinula edodes TaxID=5353 RepID=UPI001E8EAB57|nr:uncharacterized protein C8R40DRAFT_1126739 [Lentinula edodes]KAH7870277.1 hypothetical protein C8R40DRAFT_1126739 [Lentinula edodes]